MLKRRFPFLNDEDFIFQEGEKDSMLRKLEAKLGKTKAEMELLLAELQLY